MITQSTNNTPNAFNLLLQSFGVMFSNSEYERQFKQIYVVSSVITTQTFLAIGGISFLMYYEQDILIDPKNHYIPNMIRLIYSTPLILLCSFSLFFNKIKQYVEIVVIINAVVIISAQVWIFSELKNGYSYAAVGFSIIFLALSVAFVVRIGYLLLISVMTLTGTIGGHIYANNSDEGWLIVNTIGILTALLLGIVAAVIRERTARSQFMANLALNESRERGQALLASMLPEKIVERIQAGETDIADSLDEVSVVFADIVGFTSLSRRLSPTDLIRLLDDIFSRFDSAVERCSMEKISTIGDAYLAVGGMDGVFTTRELAINAVQLALLIREEVDMMIAETDYPINVRIGVHIGPVVAGVVGERRPTFDCWGDTIRLATSLESQAAVGAIMISDIVFEALDDIVETGPVQTIKNKDISETIGGRELHSLCI